MFKHSRYLFLVIILALLGFIFYPLIFMPIKNGLYKISEPLSYDINIAVIGTKNFLYNISQIQSLTRTNQELRNENLKLLAENSQLEELRHQNQLLQEELGFSKNNSTQELVPAEVIARPSNPYLSGFKINKGYKDGLKEKQPLISRGFLVGIINKVYDNYSEVTLISDSKNIIPVILSQSRGTGLLKGGLAGLSIDEVPVDIMVKPGEQVLTSSLGDLLPKDIPIGTVDKVISQESEIFQTVAVSSPISLSKLELVFVIK